MHSTCFDVAIVGAGPAGCVAAHVLSRAGMRVAVLARSCAAESTSARRAPARVDTVPPQMNMLLTELGLREVLRKCAPQECPGIVSKWFGAELVEHDFIFSPAGSAWHVDRGVFDQALLQCAEQSGAAIYTISQLSVSTEHAGGIELRDDANNVRLWCRYAIDASGTSSVMARALGATRRVFARRVAARTVVRRDALVGDQRLWIERGEQGWYYATPVGADRLQFSVVGEREHFRHGWRARLATVCARCEILALYRQLPFASAQWVVCSFEVSRLCPTVGRRWLAVGDAAAAIDPLAGQGMYWAMHSAQAAARAIVEHAAGSGDALHDYGEAVTSRFERNRQQYSEYAAAV